MTLPAVGSLLAVGAFAFGMTGLLFVATGAIAVGYDLCGRSLLPNVDRIEPVTGVVEVLAGTYPLFEPVLLLDWI